MLLRLPPYLVPGRLCALALALTVSMVAVDAQPRRITARIDNKTRVTLAGHISPQARPERDRGRVSPALQMSRVTLLLGSSDKQKADLAQLLADQQNTASPNYHHWLTPEQFAERFGANDADIAAISSWAQTQGLTVDEVARGHRWIVVSGSAAQVESAFQTEIHQYVVNGETHYANSADPTIPAAMQGVVVAVNGLNDFRLRPHHRLPANVRQAYSADPKYTSTRGSHYISPADLAILYNIKPLHDSGFDGTGQSIVVAGQTEINLSDIETFRSTFGLPAKDPQLVLVPRSRNPGISQDDLSEADLDIEWASAAATNANIIFVYSYDVSTSEQYAVDQNLAPVMTTSYGLCEAEMPTSQITSMQTIAEQGNAQGMTLLAASGDAGGADCDDTSNPGLQVDVPASLPEFTGVGGTEFVEGSGQYWNASSGAGGLSVLSYIPETSWNDSKLDGSPSASGGGASTVFSKPSWQAGPGVPSDNARHVPDVALSASADHDGYLVYTGGSQQIYGGTSAPTPSFAGIIAVLNQYLVSSGAQSTAGLGNINPKLYALAQSASTAFHDISSGNNMVTVACSGRSAFCGTQSVGFSAGPGYDEVTGLGSVDAAQLAAAWSGAAVSAPQVVDTMTLVATPSTVPTNGTLFITATVTSTDGTTPAGSVTFSNGIFALGSAPLVGSGGSATATVSVNGSVLLGANSLSAQYSPSSSATPLTASTTITIAGTASGSPSISGLTNAASFQQRYAPGMILSVFGSQLAGSNQSAGAVPLPLSMGHVAATINGEAAPMYYVSPSQLNIQIPYETNTGNATLTVNNNGQVATTTFTVSAAAPGIFTDSTGALVPYATASHGQAITLFVTGYGTVLPQISTGAAPASTAPLSSLPAPAQSTSVTIGGAPAQTLFVGVPPNLVGVLQINFIVPSGIPTGTQSVVVNVGGVNSTAAKLTVTN